MTRMVWKNNIIDEEYAKELSAVLGVDHLTARVAANRWPDRNMPPHMVSTPKDFHDPFLMYGMREAIERVNLAISQGEKIRIVTDYDVDGTTSSLVLQATFDLLGVGKAVSYHIPSRFDEGYGFSVAAAKCAADDGVGLILTADIGVRDHESVAMAKSLGVDVVILDHHLPDGASLPDDAIILCPPQTSCDYPNPSLCAVGIAFKFATAMLSDHPRWEKLQHSFLKLAAIGTVADMVSLHGSENRAIVRLGLDALNCGPHTAGLSALLEVSKVEVGTITEDDIGFRVGPRINAAGRLARAGLVVDLLRERDVRQARVLSKELDEINQKRRTIQDELVEKALQQAQTASSSSFVVVSGHEEDGWHRGVVGIVASKVKEETGKSTAVVSIQGEYAVGSVRGNDETNVVSALDSVSHLLVKYGGHPAAAGFTLRSENMEQFVEGLVSYTENENESTVKRALVDGWATVPEINFTLLGNLAKLGPYGMGVPRPLMAIRGVSPARAFVKGRNAMLSFRLHEAGNTVDFIWWGKAHLVGKLPQLVDVLGRPEINTYRGRRTVQFVISDMRESTKA